MQTTLSRLMEQDLGRLGQWARELGYRLSGAAPQELRQLRAELASLRDAPELARPEGDFVRGMLFAMAEVCASYTAEVLAREERRDLAGFGQEKPLHAAILQKIFSGVTRPSDLAAGLGKAPAQVSRALSQLRDLGLLELVSAVPTVDQRQRFHRLTTEGLRILSAQGWPSKPGEPRLEEARAPESVAAEPSRGVPAYAHQK